MPNQDIKSLLQEVNSAKNKMECSFAEWRHGGSFNIGEYFYRQSKEKYLKLKKELELKIQTRIDTLKENIAWLEWAVGTGASFYNDLRLSYNGNLIALERAKEEYEALKALLVQ